MTAAHPESSGIVLSVLTVGDIENGILNGSMNSRRPADDGVFA